MDNSTKKRSNLGNKRQLPSGRWEISVAHGYREDGRVRRVYETVDTESDADRRIVELSAELGARPDFRAGITLKTLWALYKADKGARLARKTLADYTRHMDKVWIPAFGDSDISTISRRAIQSVMLERCTTRYNAAHCKRVLSSVLSYAVNAGWLHSNPMRGASFELPGDTGSEWENEDAWNSDPFALIEGNRDVWGAQTILDAFGRMHGLPLEPVWLVMVGGGLRMEEAFALRGMDVRRVEIAGRMTTQVAVHHARTDMDERKRTKTRKSVRIAAIMEPFGERYYELAQSVQPSDLVCPCDPANQNKRWRGYFAAPPKEPERAKHVPKKDGWVHRSKLHGLPYIPLSRMRAAHSTLMQEAGVLDSINAAAHGHSQRVAYTNYQQADTLLAAQMTESYLRNAAKG